MSVWYVFWTVIFEGCDIKFSTFHITVATNLQTLLLQPISKGFANCLVYTVHVYNML